MENSSRENKNMPIQNSPKPSDQVQLEIETVTPDTEKDVLPTESSINKSAGLLKKQPIDSTGDDTNNKDSEALTTDKNQGEHQRNENAEAILEKGRDIGANHIEPKDQNSSDERDKIETISP
ncbi:hypothetical protein [Pedobacter sp. ASV28]|uniref:hypothetical protein n=1 Tax=Pedobacter sp. ASV28 TaxID=2795123 RepID=UPI0018ECB474|nr:hypothetical protein [Pedobacter sp. ASV28]